MSEAFIEGYGIRAAQYAESNQRRAMALVVPRLVLTMGVPKLEGMMILTNPYVMRGQFVQPL